MTTQAKPERRTTAVPVTTMEEVPVLSAGERQELLDSLRRAEAEIASGQGVEYELTRFRDRLLRIYRGNTR